MPERSSESGQDYAAVESIVAVGSQIPLLGVGDRRNQPKNHFLEIRSPKSWEMHFLVFRFPVLSKYKLLKTFVPPQFFRACYGPVNFAGKIQKFCFILKPIRLHNLIIIIIIIIIIILLLLLLLLLLIIIIIIIRRRRIRRRRRRRRRRNLCFHAIMFIELNSLLGRAILGIPLARAPRNSSSWTPRSDLSTTI